MKPKLNIPYWPDELDSKPLPKQLEFHRANYRFRMLSGAVRAGKSVSGCNEGVKLSFKWPGNTGAIVRNTLTELKRTTQVTFFNLFSCNADTIKEHEIIKSWNKAEQHLRFINDSDIYFIGIENWSVLKSLELGWIFVDEGIEVKSSALKFLRTRLNKKLSYPDFNQYFWTATNPGDETHILYKWFIDIPDTPEQIEERKKFFTVFTTSYDNVYLTDDYKSEIDSWKADKEFYDRYALGKWGRFKGLVYSEFDENIHVVKQASYDNFMDRIKAVGEFYAGTDWGFENPAAIILAGFTTDGDVIIFDEIYETKKTNPELRALYNNKLAQYGITIRRMYCDPAEPSDIKEFQNNGIPATKSINDIEPGIKKVKEYLRLKANGAPRLFIFERCVNLRREFRLYRRPNEDEVSDKKNIPEKPIDKDNHALGALRYFLTTHFLSSAKLQYAPAEENIDFSELSPAAKEKYKRMMARRKEEE